MILCLTFCDILFYFSSSFSISFASISGSILAVAFRSSVDDRLFFFLLHLQLSCHDSLKVYGSILYYVLRHWVYMLITMVWPYSFSFLRSDWCLSARPSTAHFPPFGRPFCLFFSFDAQSHGRWQPNKTITVAKKSKQKGNDATALKCNPTEIKR